MLKKSTGNMYLWVDATHTQIGGVCPHKCIYCYVDHPRFGRAPRYQGELRLIEDEFKVKYDQKTLMKICGKFPATIFIENCNDMFAKEIPDIFIVKIFRHCYEYAKNDYVFQSKNPARYLTVDALFPERSILGTTIETNRIIPGLSSAPSPEERMHAMKRLRGKVRQFVTIEPVLDFDVDILAGWIAQIRPEFLNLGADSKNHNLPEPTVDKIHQLVDKLKEYGIELREKHNLKRLTDK